MPTLSGFALFAQAVLNIGFGVVLFAAACWLLAGLISLAVDAWEKR